MSFAEAGNEIVNKLKEGMFEFAQDVMKDSLVEVPKESGVLARSARIMPIEETPKSLSITFGYGFGDEVSPETGYVAAEYAVPVHEILEAIHPPPTKAKYLEDPLLLHAATLDQKLALSIRTTSYATGSLVPTQEIRPVQLGIDE